MWKGKEAPAYEIKDLEEQLFKEELDLLGKKHILERMQKERRGGGPKRQKGEKHAVKGGFMWTVFGMKQYLRGIWEHFTVKRACVKAVLADAEKEKQEGIQG